MKEQRKKRLKQLAFWTVGWTLTMALATFGPKFLWGNNTIATLIAVLVNLAIGIGMILANRNVVINGDELEKKIQLEPRASGSAVNDQQKKDRSREISRRPGVAG